MQNKVLGIDVGASGIKGAIVDITTGELLTERLRLDTPDPATPKAVAKTFAQLVKNLGWEEGPIGVGFPAIMKKGVAHSAANIDKAWIGKNVEKLFSEVTQCPVKVLNDADAAGIAEMKFGVGVGEDDVVILITIGSGLGSAMFMDGVLIPNTEFGHFRLKGDIAEKYAANSIRKKHDLSWEEWGNRFNFYLTHLKRLFSPDLVILGGGVSKKYKNYGKYLTVDTRVVPAELQNTAGTVGAAIYASRFQK